MTQKQYYEDLTNREVVKETYSTSKNLDAKYEVERNYGIQKQTFEDWVVQLLGFRGDETVLDIGCGQGRILLPLGRLAKGRGGRLLGCDLTEGVMAPAKQIIDAEALPISLLLADAEQLPFLPASFDLVMANHMLYHVDIPQALREVRRVLKASGSFLATTNSQQGMAKLEELYQQTMHELQLPYPQERAISTFSLENGAAQLQQVFGQVQCFTFDSGFAVRDPQPVLTYYMATQLYQSPFRDPTLPQSKRDQLAETFSRVTAQTIEQAGGRLVISKLGGAFICQ